jgi:hypothetical protein
MAQETYNWSTDYSDEQSGGTTTFTGDSGETVHVTVSQPDPFGRYAHNGDGFETQTQGGDSGGHFQMEIDHSSNTSDLTTTIEFAGNSMTGEDSVSNLSFTLYDLDSPSSGNYQDQVMILAYDADGNLLPVTLTAVDPGVVSISGSTATAVLGGGTGGSQPGNVDATSTEGNVEVQVDGDVARLEIVYGNGPLSKANPTQQQIGISDLSFDLAPAMVCFVAGTMIETPDGPVAIEDLSEGDLVCTVDSGDQPVRWIGRRTVAGRGSLAPIRFAPGSIGNTATLFLSPQHRVLLGGWKAQLLTGSDEVLVAALHLINGATIAAAPCPEVTYFHLMFDRHEAIFANGAACESLFLSEQSLRGLGTAGRGEIAELFPELFCQPVLFGPTVRPCLQGFEAPLVA